MPKDTLFRGKRKDSVFQFDRAVSDVFDDMVERSVPFYCNVQSLILDFSSVFVMEGTAVYDIGCSTGTTLSALLSSRVVAEKASKLIGIDKSTAMLVHAKKKCEEVSESCPYELHCWDLEKDINLEASSVIILNLTLQFLTLSARKRVLQRCFEALKLGGVVIIVEKLCSPDDKVQSCYDALYHSFKKKNGYSSSEILNKQASLKTVLRPLSFQENTHLLSQTGYVRVESFFRWLNFAGFIAFKGD